MVEYGSGRDGWTWYKMMVVAEVEAELGHVEVDHDLKVWQRWGMN